MTSRCAWVIDNKLVLIKKVISMTRNEKEVMMKLRQFVANLRASLPAPLGARVFNYLKYGEIKLNADELKRMSAKLGVPLAQMGLVCSDDKPFRIYAEDKDVPMGSPRVVDVCSNAFTEGTTWDDLHPDSILRCIMEFRDIISERVITETAVYYGLVEDCRDKE